MYCPECGTEFREGFSKCSDCGAALVAEGPAKKRPGEPDLELVTVLEANDPVLLGLAKGLLEDAGIPFYSIGSELGVRFGPVTPYANPWQSIQVGADREAEARALLADTIQGSSNEADTGKWSDG
jgi:hypothetical protein